MIHCQIFIYELSLACIVTYVWGFTCNNKKHTPQSRQRVSGTCSLNTQSLRTAGASGSFSHLSCHTCAGMWLPTVGKLTDSSWYSQIKTGLAEMEKTKQEPNRLPLNAAQCRRQRRRENIFKSILPPPTLDSDIPSRGAGGGNPDH